MTVDTSNPVRSPFRRTLRSALFAGGVLLLVGVLAASGFLVLAAPPAGPRGALGPASTDPRLAPVAAPAAAAAPRPDQRPAPAVGADPSDRYVCRAINATICVSVQAGSPQIVPNLGNSTASVRPNANSSINLWIKSRYPLTTPTSPSGPYNNLTPIRINVTGTLWNGDPWMSQYSGSVWHCDSPNGPTYSVPLNGYNGGNKTYLFWYNVTVRNTSSSGTPNFFPGEYVSWFIYIVTKDPFVHRYSPVFHYWIAGAWAFSPYKGSIQYGGPNASSLDLNIHQSPSVPNWNDTVKVTISTSQPDEINNASICTARLLVTAILPNGASLPNYTGDFPTLRVGTFCSVNTTADIPSFYQQVQGTNVSYSVIAFDGYNPLRYPPDQITTAVVSYIVGGNGSFISHTFSNDIQTIFTPGSLLSGLALAPGTNVTVTIVSTNAGTALQSAQVDYTFQLPATHAFSRGVLFLGRVDSTTLTGQMPGIPLGGYLNFTILVWDYTGSVEVSPTYGYSIDTFSSLIQTVGPSLGFLWIYAFDNHSQQWINGALVSITGAGGYINVQTHTAFGVAYPNATSGQFVPLLLLANQTYDVTVAPVGVASVSIDVTLRNHMDSFATLAQGSTDTVVENGNQLFFWFNTTAPGPTFSGSPPQVPGLIGPILGLGLTIAGVAIVFPWYRHIAARRKEQERRVTL